MARTVWIGGVAATVAATYALLTTQAPLSDGAIGNNASTISLTIGAATRKLKARPAIAGKPDISRFKAHRPKSVPQATLEHAGKAIEPTIVDDLDSYDDGEFGNLVD